MLGPELVRAALFQRPAASGEPQRAVPRVSWFVIQNLDVLRQTSEKWLCGVLVFVQVSFTVPGW